MQRFKSMAPMLALGLMISSAKIPTYASDAIKEIAGDRIYESRITEDSIRSGKFRITGQRSHDDRIEIALKKERGGFLTGRAIERIAI